ncbi:Tmtc3 [Symbiodinium natans]|uniref:Tmtc3 protein n=1 Tax=Symbiodinium natans TaxID=878477 RepID=A0A812UQ09_9DINO|nr:Tmtc3 [Symbiodinium natans]
MREWQAGQPVEAALYQIMSLSEFLEELTVTTKQPATEEGEEEEDASQAAESFEVPEAAAVYVQESADTDQDDDRELPALLQNNRSTDAETLEAVEAVPVGRDAVLAHALGRADQP